MARQPNEKLLKNFLKLLESESIRRCLQISSELKLKKQNKTKNVHMQEPL